MAKKVKMPGRIESSSLDGIVTGAAEIFDDGKEKMQNVINTEVSAELLRLENEKQNNLTIDNTPTEGSRNPVTSGGVFTAEKALSDAIEAILILIPSAATALNQLADKSFVESSLSTATATFRGTYNVVSDLGLAYNATHEQIAAKLGQVISTADNNDYCFVQVPESATSTDIKHTERYKFNGSVWAYEYDLNNSGFTADQWAAINSNITAVLVAKLTQLPTAEVLATLLAGKQDNLTFDDRPTAGSDNPVKSGGVYASENEIIALINALELEKQEKLTFDSTPTNGSSNPVTSGGVYEAIYLVQVALASLDNRVISAEHSISVLTENVGILRSLYQALTSGDIIVGSLPTTGVANTVYRVPGVSTYADWMYYNGAWVKLAEYTTLDGYLYKGIAIPSGSPAASAVKMFYFALTAGIYTNFGGLVCTEGINILKYDGANWTKEQITYTDGGVFDISAYHATGGTLATYANLSAALDSNNGGGVPQSLQKGGMSVKYVRTSDNKYVQWRYMGTSTTNIDFTNPDNWQGVEEGLVSGSKNLAESGYVSNKFGNVFEETQSYGEYVNYDYHLIAGVRYKITNISESDNTVDIRGRDKNNQTLYDVVSSLRKNTTIYFTPQEDAAKIGVKFYTANGTLYICEADSVNNKIEEVKEALMDEIETSENNISKNTFDIKTLYNNKVSIIPNSKVLLNRNIDANGDIQTLIGYTSYIFDLKNNNIVTVGTYGTSTLQYQLVFYSSIETINSTTCLGGHYFESSSETLHILDTIPVPPSAVCAVVINKSSLSNDIFILGFDNTNLRDIEQKELTVLEDYKYVGGNGYGYYIKSDGSISLSSSWMSYIIDISKDKYKEIFFSGYSNNITYYAIAYYSGLPSSSTFISGIVFDRDSGLIDIYTNIESVPDGTRYILISTRTASGNDSSVKLVYDIISKCQNNTIGIEQCQKQIDAINYSELFGKSEEDKLYKNLISSNDIVFIKDELWVARTTESGGASVDTITRYKFNKEGNIYTVGTLATDFGHFNSVDYNDKNDCLVLTNSANDVTEDNFFAIIKDPLSLSGSVSLEDVAIIYRPDVGYKINACWGDSNFGENNILYIISNDFGKLSKVLLKKDSSGNFNGAFLVLESNILDIITNGKLNGLDYWNNTLYFGVGYSDITTFNLGELRLEDLSYKEIKNKYYNGDGSVISGGLQGISVDSEYIWTINNISDTGNNFLIKKCR